MTESPRIALVAAALAVVAGLTGAPARAAGEPRGIHVAFGEDARAQATVTWFTDGDPDPGSALRYGTTPDALDVTVSGWSQVVPGEYDGGTVRAHEVALSGLEPGSTLFYSVGGGAAWSETTSFRTAPADEEPFTFTAFGDHGVKASSVATTDAVRAADPAFHLIAGDLSYAYHGDGSFPVWEDWDTWFDQLEPLAQTVPVMPALGNHEMESIGGTASFRARFALPRDETTYSFDYANVHVLVYNSDRNAGAQEARLPDQLAFAAADLADAAARRDAGEIDFIVVVQHHPLYGFSATSIESQLIERHYNPYLIATEEALLQAYGVDVLVAAHNHYYGRSFPMRAGRPTSDARATYTTDDDMIQVITGGGGQGLHSMLPQDQWPDWVAAGARRFHFVEFTVDGPTLTVTARATDGGAPAVLDAFTLARA